MMCSRCKSKRSDGWPAIGPGELCQDCWEAQCSEEWWATLAGPGAGDEAQLKNDL